MTASLVFYGNCQIQVLCQSYETFAVPHTGDRTIYIPAAPTPSAIARDAVAAADIVVEQITPMGGQPPLAGIPASARRLRVPVVDGSFLWPYSGERHPDSPRRYPGYHPFPAEMGDAWLLRRLTAGAAPEQAVADYLALDIAKAGHLERRFEIAMEMQRAREADTAYAFAPLIEHYFRIEKLFRTPYHLEARLSRHMLLTFLDDLGASAMVKRVAETFATTTLFGGSDLPVHPGTAAHFGLSWAGAGTRVPFWREAMLTFEDYAWRFVRCEAYPEMNQAAEAVIRNAPGAPALLAAALDKIPDSPWGLHAAAIQHIRAGDFADALSLLERVVALHPRLAGAYVAMHDALMGLGRTEEATAALVAAVEREPFRTPLQMRLARHFKAMGRLDLARDAVAAVLMLDPSHEKGRRLAAVLGVRSGSF